MNEQEIERTDLLTKVQSVTDDLEDAAREKRWKLMEDRIDKFITILKSSSPQTSESPGLMNLDKQLQDTSVT